MAQAGGVDLQRDPFGDQRLQDFFNRIHMRLKIDRNAVLPPNVLLRLPEMCENVKASPPHHLQCGSEIILQDLRDHKIRVIEVHIAERDAVAVGMQRAEDNVESVPGKHTLRLLRRKVTLPELNAAGDVQATSKWNAGFGGFKQRLPQANVIISCSGAVTFIMVGDGDAHHTGGHRHFTKMGDGMKSIRRIIGMDVAVKNIEHSGSTSLFHFGSLIVSPKSAKHNLFCCSGQRNSKRKTANTKRAGIKRRKRVCWIKLR